MSTKKNLLFKISTDIREFQAGIRQATTDMRRFGNQMKSIGAGISAAFTLPATAFATGAIMAFRDYNEQLKQVKAGIESTGGAAGFSAQQLEQMAKGLSKMSSEYSGGILGNVTAQLLTFTNVAGDQFARAQVAILDVATRMKTDLKSAAIMVGKALNEPVEGLTAMRRVGIQFTDQQQEMIKTLVDSGKTIEAQGVILDELQRQFGGSAAASGDSMKHMQNAARELGTEFGALIYQFIDPLIQRITGLLNWIKGLSSETKSIIVVVGGLVAAIGPLLIGIGFLSSTLIPQLIIGFKAVAGALKGLQLLVMANPWTALATAIAAVAAGLLIFRKNTDEAADAQKGLLTAVKDINDEIADSLFYKTGAITVAIDSNGVKSFQFDINRLIDSVGQLEQRELEALRVALERKIAIASREAANATSKLEQQIAEIDLKDYKAGLEAVNNELAKFKTTTDDAAKSTGLIGQLKDQLKALRDRRDIAGTVLEIARLNDEIAQLEEKLTGLLNLTAKRFDLLPEIGNRGPVQIQWTEKKKTEMDSQLRTRTGPSIEKQLSWLGELRDQAYEINQIFAGIALTIGQTLSSAFDAALVKGENFFTVFIRGLAEMVKKLIAAALAALALSVILSTITGGANQVLGVLGKGGAGFGDLFKTLFGTLAGIPGMAKGGIVPPGFPNDSYPAMLTSREMVIPRPEALPMLGNNLYVTGRLIADGSQLVAVIENANMKRNKIRGY